MRLMFSQPRWLDPESWMAKNRPRTVRYFSAMFSATPQWLTRQQRRDFHSMYRRAREMRARGLDVAVDHIVPLVHPYVCGLNVPWNLQIISAAQNGAKGNKWWPDCPHETIDMFDKYQPQQLRLF